MSKKLRILHIIPTLSTGGAEMMMVRLIEHLDPIDFESAAVSLFPRVDSTLVATLEAAGVEVHHLNKTHGFDPRLFGRLLEVLDRYRPDVVHTHLTALA